MRIISGQNLGKMMIILGVGLALGISACGKKDDHADMPPAASASQVKQQAQPASQASRQTAPVTRTAPTQSRPAPEAPIDISGAARTVTREYRCNNKTNFRAVFAYSPNAVAITFPGRVTVTMRQKYIREAGFLYESSQYALRGQGPNAQWIMHGREPVECSLANLAR